MSDVMGRDYPIIFEVRPPLRASTHSTHVLPRFGLKSFRLAREISPPSMAPFTCQRHSSAPSSSKATAAKSTTPIVPSSQSPLVHPAITIDPSALAVEPNETTLKSDTLPCTTTGEKFPVTRGESLKVRSSKRRRCQCFCENRTARRWYLF